MNERHFAGEAGEESGFFHGGIAAADDDDFLAGEKEAVAGGAGGDAVADESLLVGQAEPARGGSAGNDESTRLDDILADGQLKWALAEVGLADLAHAILGAEALGLLAHVLDQFRTLHAFGKTRKIFDQRGERELSAGVVTLQDERLEVGASAVESGSVPGAARADDDNVASVHNLYQ